MTEHLSQTLESFLDATAERAPAPGGGAVASLVGALGASLSRMVTAYSVGSDTTPKDKGLVEKQATRLHRADQLLRALVTQDAAAYEAMTKARKESKKDPTRRPAYQKAVLEAIAVPMEVAGLASDILAAMDELKSGANRYLLSDLAAAGVIAFAAARAAEWMVLTNVPELDDPAMRRRLKDQIDRTLMHCRDHEVSIERFVHDTLESP